MLVGGEGAPQDDLDSCWGHLLAGSPIITLILEGTPASWVTYYDLDSCKGHLLIGANFF